MRSKLHNQGVVYRCRVEQQAVVRPLEMGLAQLHGTGIDRFPIDNKEKAETRSKRSPVSAYPLLMVRDFPTGHLAVDTLFIQRFGDLCGSFEGFAGRLGVACMTQERGGLLDQFHVHSAR